MPTILPEGIRVPAGIDPYALTDDLRKMMESATTIVPVANVPARAALVAALVAANRPPSTSDPLYVDRADAATADRLEVTYDGTTWEAFSRQTFVGVPMIGTWQSSKIFATAVGTLVTVTGTVATGSVTVPSGVSQAVGVVPAGYRPAGELAHGPLSGQILGSTLPYSARGSVVVETNGNLSIYTELLLTTGQFTLSYRR